MIPVVVNWGMGADSSYILARIFRDPKARASLGIAPDFGNLLVVTAQVGHEYLETRRLGEKYILPLLRERHVRFVQVARSGASMKRSPGDPGYMVIDDTRSPHRLHTEGGGFTLGEEMLQAGTVPQFRANSRTCSQKFKGVPLDRFLEDEFGTSPFTQVMGFNADERRRAERDDSYTASRDLRRKPRYPLIEWGVGRKELEHALHEWFGRPWGKSCCTFCPFQGTKAGRDDVMERIQREPRAGAEALYMEHVAHALNPEQTLFATRGGVRGFLEARRHAEAKGAFVELERMLQASKWALYHVQRVTFRTAGGKSGSRNLKILSSGSKSAMDKALRTVARDLRLEVETDDAGTSRAWKLRRGAGMDTAEELYVVAPLAAKEKLGRGFEEKWIGEPARGSSKLPAVATPERASARPKAERDVVTADEIVKAALRKYGL